MKKGVLLAIAMLTGMAMAAPASAAGQRVKITGEVIDTWCYITEIMFAEGTAHHQCALWCAAGGVPVGVLADDGQVYMVLKLAGDATSVANPAVMNIQSHRVTVDGEVYDRDGINYLVVNQVVADSGIVKKTHDEYGIQPFGK
jgi:type 1 fimbria pilin